MVNYGHVFNRKMLSIFASLKRSVLISKKILSCFCYHSSYFCKPMSSILSPFQNFIVNGLFLFPLVIEVITRSIFSAICTMPIFS